MAGAQAEIDALLAEVQAQSPGAPEAASTGAARTGGTAAGGGMAAESGADRQAPEGLGRILRIKVPLMVVLARRKMRVREILNICIGSIIEFDKPSDEELELLVNNRSIAFGHAVKVGEDFGLRVMRIHDVRSRIDALRSEA